MDSQHVLQFSPFAIHTAMMELSRKLSFPDTILSTFQLLINTIPLTAGVRCIAHGKTGDIYKNQWKEGMLIYQLASLSPSGV